MEDLFETMERTLKPVGKKRRRIHSKDLEIETLPKHFESTESHLSQKTRRWFDLDHEIASKFEGPEFEELDTRGAGEVLNEEIIEISEPEV